MHIEFLRMDQRWFQMFRKWTQTKTISYATVPLANFEAVPESPPGLVSANMSAYELAIKGHVCDSSFDVVALNCNCFNLQISSFRLFGNSTLSRVHCNIVNWFWTHATQSKEDMHLHNALLYRLILCTVYYCKKIPNTPIEYTLTNKTHTKDLLVHQTYNIVLNHSKPPSKKHQKQPKDLFNPYAPIPSANGFGVG